jgi:hypothetical protein
MSARVKLVDNNGTRFHCVGSYISGRLTCIDRISDDESLPEKEEVLIPTKLSTEKHSEGIALKI